MAITPFFLIFCIRTGLYWIYLNKENKNVFNLLGDSQLRCTFDRLSSNLCLTITEECRTTIYERFHFNCPIRYDNPWQVVEGFLF